MTKRISSDREPSLRCRVRLSRRNDAQMAFSLVAVIILMISGIAITVITSNTVTTSSSSEDDPKAEEMDKAVSIAARFLSDSAYLIGLNLLNETYLNDPNSFQRLFTEAIQSSIGSSFPYSDGKHTLTIVSQSIIMARMPAAGIEDGSQSIGSRSSNLIAFFRVCGIAQINVSGTNGQLVQNVSIDRPIYFPLPLLEGSWDRFESLVQDDDSMLWKMVRYELTALVQMRMYQNTFSMQGPSWSSQALTEEDVRNAVIVSSILLQRAVFTTYDEKLLDELASPNGCQIFVTEISSSIESEGLIDPADVFLRLYGLDQIDVRSLIAQSLYASADLIALRLIEYLRVADVINSIEEVVETGIFLLNDAISFVLGKDSESENARKWVEHKFDGAGIDEEVYRYLWGNDVDWTVTVPSTMIALINSTGGYEKVVIGGDVAVDLPSADVLRSELWKDFCREYEIATSDLTNSLVGLVRELSISIASMASINSVTLLLDPFDGISPMDEMIGSVSETLGSTSDYFQGSANSLTDRGFEDPMGMSLSGSIEDRFDDFYRHDEVMSSAFRAMSESIYDSILREHPSFDQAPEDFNIGTIEMTLSSNLNMNLTGQMEMLFDADAAANLAVLRSGLTSPSGNAPSFWQNIMSSLITGQVMNSFGIEAWIEGNVNEMLDDMAAATEIRGGPFQINLKGMDSYLLSNENGLRTGIRFHILTDIDDGLSITITDPEENAGGRLNPNLHMTDLFEGSMSPFISCWSYNLECRFNMDISFRQVGDPSVVHQSYHGFTYTGTNSDIITSTGWPMDSVDYDPTNTLDSDALSFIEDVWDGFLDIFRTLGRTVSQAYELVQSMRSMSTELVSEAIEIAGQAIQVSIETLQEVLRAMVLGGACLFIDSLTDGKNIELFEMRLLGAHVEIELNSRDPALSGAKSIVKVTMGLEMGGSSVHVTSRLFRDASNEFCFLINASVRSDLMKLAMIIDPFMSSYPHLVEVKGWVGEYYVDICMPEVVRYRQFGFSLAELPGIGTLLSNIPLPIPGLKGQINAGITMKLATDSEMGPVINEFELNPKGRDDGNEWVEIFNPTSDVVSLSGWTIETMHGKKAIEDLGEILLLPYSRTVYEFDEQALDNGAPGCLPEGESLVLRDATGKRVDTAPFVPDVKNDARTWQRAHDGSESWEFRKGTKGYANSVTVSRWVRGEDATITLQGIVVQTLEILEASGSSLSSLGLAMQMSMTNAITSLVEELGGAIIDVGLFIEISIVEESGSVGATAVYSLSTDGSIIVESWDWLCSSIRDMIMDPLSSMRSIGKQGLPEIINENVWFGMSSGMKIKTPQLLGAKQSVSCKVSTVVKVNIAATGILMGQDSGRSKMVFGICMSGVMSDKLPLLGIRAGEQVDVWLIKGTLLSNQL